LVKKVNKKNINMRITIFFGQEYGIT
jgi:hypothetical protein